MNIYKQELPKSRVNITVDVNTFEGLRKKELPFKLLVLGNFSGDKSQSQNKGQERVLVSRHTFNQVLAKVSPEVTLLVEDKLQNKEACLTVPLRFEKLQDFRPENIVQQVPRLKKMLAMRNLLKELKAHMAANPSLRNILNSVGHDKQSLINLQHYLHKLSIQSENMEMEGEKN